MRLPISHLAVSSTVSETLTLKSRKWLIFPIPHPCLAPPLGDPLKFLDETYPQK